MLGDGNAMWFLNVIIGGACIAALVPSKSTTDAMQKENLAKNL